MTPRNLQKFQPSQSRPPNSGQADASLGADLQQYMAVLTRYWWLVLGAGALTLGAAWWTQRDEVPEYTAEVLLQHQPEQPVASQIERQLGVGGGGMEFGAHAEIIRSRAVLDPVVDSLGLQLALRNHRDDFTSIVKSVEVRRDAPYGSYRLEVSGPNWQLRRADADSVLARLESGAPVEGPGFSVELAPEEVEGEPLEFAVLNREAGVNRLKGGLEIEKGKGSDLIWVRYTSPDPELAAHVTNAIASSYQRHRAQSARQAARRRRNVISNQLVELADSLRNEQQKLLNYQRSSQVLDPEVQGNALLQERFDAEAELRRLRYEEGLLESMVASLESGNITDNFQRILATGQDLVPGLSPLRQRLQELQDEKQRLTASRFGHTEESPEVQVVDSLMATTRQDIRVAVEEALQGVRSRMKQTQSRLEEVRSETGNLPTRSASYDRLRQRVDAVQEVFDMLVEKYYEAQIAEGVEAGDINVVDEAVVPLSPDPSRRGLTMVLGLMVGLMLGGVGALTLNYFDRRMRTAGDVESLTEVSVLGTVPRVKPESKDRSSVILGKEAFRGIRTNLRYALSGQPRTVAVTSSVPGEGKSTVASNLAVTMAEGGLKVVLVDADLRRPQVHRIFGVERQPGLSDVLSDSMDPRSVVRQHFGANLFLIPSGRSIGNPADILDGPAFGSLLEQLKSEFDVVVLDTPPLLAVTDAGLVAAQTEGTILVVEARSTDADMLEKSTEQLRRLGAKLAGIVMNSVSSRDVDGRYGYSYHDDYYTGTEVSRSESGRELLLRPASEGDERSA